MNEEFILVTDLKPKGDQPKAIEQLVDYFKNKQAKTVTLLGVTGSGKTFTMAHLIAQLQLPTLVISHNKTLAAQLYSEFKEFFPYNAVHYFISYYDYYQPEAYIPERDIYIEKDASINENIEKLRLAATNALMTRKDVIIVASVSCIYNIGSPEDFETLSLTLKIGECVNRNYILQRLTQIQYQRSEVELKNGKFRIRGEYIDIFPSYSDYPVRIYLGENEEVLKIVEFDYLNGNILNELKSITIFPAKHFVLPKEKIEMAIESIMKELEEEVEKFKREGKMLEAHRLETRTKFDIEMMKEIGYCKGIENYSRHLSGRLPGQRPFTLIDYFPKEFLCIVDESHVTIPQLRGMYNGDRSRKKSLIEYGFRLPSAYDNRPMKFEEWEKVVDKVLFVSATPAQYEIEKSENRVVEQIIRPTGLVDPKITVHPTKGQIEFLLAKIKERIKNNEKVVVTTLTKRLAEDVAQYLATKNIKVNYLHSEIDVLNRAKILRDLRTGVYDVLVGVNLLREGLDLPEVSLVAIFDADKEGFLRSQTSLIQTMGRTARNVNGEVILFADVITKSMENAIRETERRRKIQLEYNEKHGITPQTIQKEIRKGIEELLEAEEVIKKTLGLEDKVYEVDDMIYELEKLMFEAAEKLEFEKAAQYRDMIKTLREKSKGIRKSKRLIKNIPYKR